MPPPQDVAAHRLAAPQQIPDRFLRLIGHMDGGQLAGAEQPDQLPGIPLVGLDALARAPRGQRRRDHLTRHAEPGDLAIEVVARHAGLVTDLDRALALHPLDQAAQESGIVGNLAELGLLAAGAQDPDDELPLAVIDSHERSTLSHDRPPFACGSVPCPEQPTLMCDR
jgi:hypothetical protein